MEKIAVLGAGVMGTAVAFHLSNIGHQVNLWGTELDEQIIKTRKQEKLGINIPESINVFHFNQIKKALKEMTGQTVEGYTTLKGIHRVATELEKEGKLTIQNDLFLFHNLYKIVYENRPVQVIVQNYGDQRGGKSKRKSS